MIRNEIEIEDYEKYEEPLYPIIDNIEEHRIENLSYNEFFDRFMVKNIPVLITGVANQWECMNWIADSKKNHINFAYLKENIDNTQNVPIANCNKVYFNSHEKLEMKFVDFLNYWKCRHEDNGNESKDLLYLKDWHLRRNQPNYQFYETPFCFASDWLNEFCEGSQCDDYRFVYMGPKGSW